MTLRFTEQFWKERPVATDGTVSDGLSPVSSRVSAEAHFASSPTRTLQTSDTEQSQQADRQSFALFVPENYEPNYAYPLIIWLHGAGGNERELQSVMDGISPQNYLGMAFRGSLPSLDRVPYGWGWSQSDRALMQFENKLYHSVRQLRREYNIHSERILLAGFDQGATLAQRLLLDRPEWFAGAAAFCGPFPNVKTPLLRFRGLQGKRLLLGTGSHDRVALPGEMMRTRRLLHAAGMEVSTTLSDSAHELTPEMLRELNHWAMGSLCTNVC